MVAIRTVIVILLLHFRACKGKIQLTQANFISDRFFVYNEIVTEVLSTCNYQHRQILIHDSKIGNIIPFFNNHVIRNCIIMNQFYQNNKKLESKLTSAIDAIFVVTYDKGTFPNIILSLKSMKWWNPRIPFYVLSKSNHSCGDRIQILQTSWKFNVLNLLLMCQMYDAHKKLVTLIYTYSPYGNNISRPWQQLTQYGERSGLFLIFNRLHRKGRLCQQLDFDRCRKLNGAKLKIGTDYNDYNHNIPKTYEWNKFLSERIAYPFLENNDWLWLLKKCLNIEFEVTFIGASTLRRQNNTKLIKIADQIEIDIILFTVTRTINDYVIGYPYVYTDYTIVSIFPGWRNLFEHAYHILGKWMLAGMIILLIITFFVIWYSNQEKTIFFAILEIVRLLINASLETRMDTLPSRIFFIVIFLYFLIIQTLFQGELANFFANPPRRPGVKSLETLEKSSFKTIYGTPQIRPLIENDPILRRKIKTLHTPWDCIELLLLNRRSACILSRYHAHETLLIAPYLYVSPYTIHRSFDYHLIRKNSPLRDRINKASLMLWEHGFSQILIEKRNKHKLTILKRKEVMRYREKAPINRRHIMFVISFLIIGLCCAFFCFVSEIIFYNRQKLRHMINKRKNFRLMWHKNKRYLNN